MWVKAAVQILTALVFTYVAMAAEWKYQAIDHFSHWVRDMKTFTMWMLFIVTVGGSRSAFLCSAKASCIHCLLIMPSASTALLQVDLLSCRVKCPLPPALRTERCAQQGFSKIFPLQAGSPQEFC